MQVPSIFLCRYPQQMQLGSIGTTGEGRDIKVGRKNTGLCNDSPKYFACHVNNYMILLLNLFLYNSKLKEKTNSGREDECQQQSANNIH